MSRAGEAAGVAGALERAWSRSDALFALVDDGAFGERPIPLRQPIVFYVGHLPAFLWNQLGRGALRLAPLRADFEALFERGIDPLDVGPEGLPAAEWPPLAEILAYRDAVRDAARRALDAAAGRPDVQRIARLALEHELMHHETLLYMLQELPHRAKRAPGDVPPPERGAAPPVREVAIPAGRVVLGAEPHAFGWDNEFPAHEVAVPAFRLDDTPVTNAAFRAFVEAGGYADPAHWDAGGWRFRERHALRRPHGWSGEGQDLAVRTLFEDVAFDVAADWPVTVSWAEAAAFARWRGARLPSEAELARAARTAPDGTARRFPWGDEPPGPAHGNFGFAAWSPVPAGSRPRGDSAWGVHELVGNGWEWTRTPFGPFPGFGTWHTTYPGYSSDFFDGQHVVMLGASWATDPLLVRPSFRNWFQPHYPYVFSKFRLARGGRS